MVRCKTSRMLLILSFFSICFAVVADFLPKGDVRCRPAMHAASKLWQKHPCGSSPVAFKFIFPVFFFQERFTQLGFILVGRYVMGHFHAMTCLKIEII